METLSSGAAAAGLAVGCLASAALLLRLSQLFDDPLLARPARVLAVLLLVLGALPLLALEPAWARWHASAQGLAALLAVGVAGWSWRWLPRLLAWTEKRSAEHEALLAEAAQRRQAETHSKQAEELFRRVVEAAPNGLLLVDGLGRIRLANRHAEQLFGYAPGSLQGVPVNQLVPKTRREAHQSLLEAAFTEGATRAMGSGRDVHGLRRDGSELPLEIGLSPIDMPEGRCTLASVIDITDRRRRDDELRRSNAELEQFAYIASHDLQEPLRMVASYTELLEQRYKGQLDERADKYIHYAVDGAKRMQRLVADLLAYSRVGSQGKPLQPVSAAAVLERVLQVMAAPMRAANAQVRAEALPTVLADEGQLQQLLQNLIGNALKFRSEAPPLIELSVTRESDTWTFAVRDNGIGIEPQYSERIFQMFQRLHERGRYEGSGIGLSIAKRILERHGGRIWLESTPGRGTTFFFTLPAAAPA